MTGQEQQQQQSSAFTERADAAALSLKGDLSKRLGIDLPETKVEVGPDGKPQRPLPPEGSYMRQAIEQQRAEQRAQSEQAALEAMQQQQTPTQQPVQQQPRAEVPPNGQPPQPEDQLSGRAQQRISELVTQLRDKDQQIQRMQTEHATSHQTVQQMQAQLESMRGQYEHLIKQNLDSLDPETRQEVLTSARIQEAVAASERRILSALQPQIESFQQQNYQRELAGLSRYQAFDAATHVPLIEAFRERNPNCSVEQAFRAIATPEELASSLSARSPAVPPTPAPGSPMGTPRYMPPQHENSDPEKEMVEEAAKARDLARTGRPEDQKAAMRMFDKNIRDRLSHRLPGQ